MEDIIWHQRELTQKINQGQGKLEDVVHLGHMVASYSDRNVPNFSARLSAVQDMGEQYANLLKTKEKTQILQSPESREKVLAKFLEPHYRRVVDKSLSLNADNRRSLMQTLNSIRSFDGDNNVEEKIDQSTMSAAQAGELFPKQWKDRITDPVDVMGSSDFNSVEEEGYGHGYAGFYDEDFNRIVIHDFDARGAGTSLDESYDGLVSTQNIPFNQGIKDYYVVAAHEFGHKYESMSARMLDLSMAFLRHRVVKDENGEEMTIMNPDTQVDRAVDHFPDHYTGSYYIRQGETYPYTTEVVSMGMEGTLLGTQGSFIGIPTPSPFKGVYHLDFNRPDPEYRNFMLGLLAAFEIEDQNTKGV